jgi:hypothetical protein
LERRLFWNANDAYSTYLVGYINGDNNVLSIRFNVTLRNVNSYTQSLVNYLPDFISRENKLTLLQIIVHVLKFAKLNIRDI